MIGDGIQPLVYTGGVQLFLKYQISRNADLLNKHAMVMRVVVLEMLLQSKINYKKTTPPNK